MSADEAPNHIPILAVVGADVRMGPRVTLSPFINLYGCVIGADTRIGPFVEIQRDVLVGDRCKISSHSFICAGVTLEDEVFIGHGVIFINDRRPRATNDDGSLQTVTGGWNEPSCGAGRRSAAAQSSSAAYRSARAPWLAQGQ